MQGLSSIGANRPRLHTGRERNGVARRAPSGSSPSLRETTLPGKAWSEKQKTERQMQPLENARIAIIGLGYVGLPLAVEFGKRYDTVGFDINSARVDELR